MPDLEKRPVHSHFHSGKQVRAEQGRQAPRHVLMLGRAGAQGDQQIVD